MTKPDILVGIIDHFDPEVQAMMIAMYSRSYAPIASRLPQTQEEELSLKERLSKFYVGYGHKSVGQLGSTTVFFEGVSQLAAKAIEDNPLFDGQESSTRYIDFSSQPNIQMKLGIEEFDNAIVDCQEELRSIYVKAVADVSEKLKNVFPFDQTQSTKTVWENTIKARTFDICRSILPAGAVTNVAFCGSFDTLNDHFGAMLHHPAEEMRGIAQAVIEGLAAKYSHATAGVEKLKTRFEYMSDIPSYFYGSDPHPSVEVIMDRRLDRFHTGRSPTQRDKWEHMPKSFSSQIRLRLGGKLDFGSFRDLHRHRNGVCHMPMLTPELGIHPWYSSELPQDIRDRLNAVMERLKSLTFKFSRSGDQQVATAIQYAVPMGARVYVQYECDFNQLAYLIELRSGKTVHQTLRHYMHGVYEDLSVTKPQLAELIHPDLDYENFTLKRGTQTFAGEFK
jgi:thymidylate synthase ThyX